MTTDVTIEEERGAYRWFFGVGIFAVCFSIFLATVDKRLSESDREVRLGDTLHELRTAQSSLASRVTDARLHVGGESTGH